MCIFSEEYINVLFSNIIIYDVYMCAREVAEETTKSTSSIASQNANGKKKPTHKSPSYEKISFREIIKKMK